ncbi:MAG: hypothetical protein AABZ60_04535 [Planctomycetota bacterium]
MSYNGQLREYRGWRKLNRLIFLNKCMELEQEFFDYLIQQNYITPETLTQWTQEYQKYRNIFDSLPSSQLAHSLKPHEKTQILRKSHSPNKNRTAIISSEILGKMNKEAEEVSNEPLQAPSSKDEIDLLMEIEKYSQTHSSKAELEESIFSTEQASRITIKDSQNNESNKTKTESRALVIDPSTVIFNLQNSSPKKAIEEFDPLLQPTRLSVDNEVKYFEWALQEKQKAFEFSKTNHHSEVLNCLLKAFSFLSIVHFLNTENSVITHEKQLIAQWIESFLVDNSES